MGNFEKLSVLVIVVIIVMILVVALHTWSEKPGEEDTTGKPGLENVATIGGGDPAAGGSFKGDQYEPGAEDWTTPIYLKEGDDKLPALPPVDEGDELDIKLDGPKGDSDTPDKPDQPAAPTEYVIQPGDTLSEIAQDVLGSIRHVSKITDINPGVDPSALRPGTKLRLPVIEGAPKRASSTRDEPDAPKASSGAARPGGTYVARAGDTCERISKRVYGTKDRWPDIFAENSTKVDDPDRIVAGTEIKLPK